MSDRAELWEETIAVLSAQALGKAIRRRRHALGVSQRQLAEQTRIDASAISELELGGGDTAALGVVLRLVNALRLDLELRPRGSLHTSRPPRRLIEFGLSPQTITALKKEGLRDVEQLGSATAMLERPAFAGGVELYEIVCALNRYGLSLPGCPARRIPTDREREIFRLRIVEGWTLRELARAHDLNGPERIRQILAFFGVSGKPPAASRRQTPTRRAADG